MQTLSSAHVASDPKSRRCPVCHGTTNRIPRGFLDLLISLFTPVQRYRCRTFGCEWEGIIRVK